MKELIPPYTGVDQQGNFIRENKDGVWRTLNIDSTMPNGLNWENVVTVQKRAANCMSTQLFEARGGISTARLQQRVAKIDQEDKPITPPLELSPLSEIFLPTKLLKKVIKDCLAIDSQSKRKKLDGRGS